MTIRECAKIFGVVFLLIGVLGFVPGINHNGQLLGIFEVNLWHNLVHVFTGFISYFAGRTSIKASKLFFQIFGVVYLSIGLLGFGYQNAMMFGFLANNLADAFLHTGIGLVSLYFGFLYKQK